MREAALISSTELETSVMQMWQEPGELARERDASTLAKSVCTVRMYPPYDLVTMVQACAHAIDPFRLN